MTLLVIPLVLVGFAVLAVLFGADSRDGRDWQPGLWGPGPLRP